MIEKILPLLLNTAHENLPECRLVEKCPRNASSVGDIILCKVKQQFALVYIDDIVIFSRTLQEHTAHKTMDLKLFKDVSVALKLKKCAFFTNRIEYLGHFTRPC